MDQQDDNKLFKKIADNPSVPIGVAGLVGVLLYGAYSFKNKKNKTSVFLIQLRVAAQGAVIGSITVGLIYTLCKNSLSKLFPEKKN